ncbi:MAG: PIN domain-containing protein [Candidatus Hydrogenedentes bacterium]|nr:PIN domain-containing protein [Candidatus Hydrogenedentota bacterium]
MTRVFADTAFYIALLNPHDNLHGIACEISRKAPVYVTTTEYVLVELANHFSHSDNRVMLSQFVKNLEAQAITSIQYASSELFHQGMELYEKRPDKDWSLVDCISFVVMGKEDIQDALTGDHHFIQAGFNILMN